MNGQETTTNGRSAVESIKVEFRKLKPYLPDDWRQKMKSFDPFYATDKGSTRMTHIRSGAVAPTLEELKFLQSISGE